MRILEALLLPLAVLAQRDTGREAYDQCIRETTQRAGVSARCSALPGGSTAQLDCVHDEIAKEQVECGRSHPSTFYGHQFQLNYEEALSDLKMVACMTCTDTIYSRVRGVQSLSRKEAERAASPAPVAPPKKKAPADSWTSGSAKPERKAVGRPKAPADVEVDNSGTASTIVDFGVKTPGPPSR